MLKKTALITGVTGQIGSYLAEFLLKKGYIVHGLVRRSSSYNRERIEHLYNPDHETNFFLHYGDINDSVSLMNILQKVQPDEIYNLAAQSHVQISWEVPIYTAETTGLGVLRLLEAVKTLGLKSKILQASTSEMFSGDPKQAPQNENTPLDPQSPYAAAKVYAHRICNIYRKAFGMYVSCAIMFNNESPRRGENFVTQKIILGIKDILQGKSKKIYLGNLQAKRDWGYTPDYVEALWFILQQPQPDDFVVATGETHTVQEFLEEACELAGLDWKKVYQKDLRYFRPLEVDYLCGDASKINRLGWKPKTKFKELVKIMFEAIKAIK